MLIGIIDFPYKKIQVKSGAFSNNKRQREYAIISSSYQDGDFSWRENHFEWYMREQRQGEQYSITLISGMRMPIQISMYM